MKIYFIIIITSLLSLLSAQDVTYEAYFLNDDGVVEEKAKAVKGEVFDSKMMRNPITTIENASFLFLFKTNKLKIDRNKILNGKEKSLYIKFTYVDTKSGIPYEPIVCLLDNKWFTDQSKSRKLKKQKFSYPKDKKINPIDNVQLIEQKYPYQVKLIFKKAKTVIKGRILDKNNKPIDAVTAKIIEVSTSGVSEEEGKGDKTISDKSGNFEFVESFKRNNPVLQMRLLFVKKGFIPKFMKLSINNQKENNLTINLYESKDGTVIPADYCYKHNQIYNKICGECTCPEGEKWYPEIHNCDQICEKGKAPIFTYCEDDDKKCQKNRQVESCEDEWAEPPIPPPLQPTNKTLQVSFINNNKLIQKNMEVYYGDWIEKEELDEITFDMFQSDDRLYKIGTMKNGKLEVIHDKKSNNSYCAEYDPKFNLKSCDKFAFDAQYFIDGIPTTFIFVDSYDDKLYKYSLSNISEFHDLTNISMIKLELNFNNQGGLLIDKILVGDPKPSGKIEYKEYSDYLKSINNRYYESKYRLEKKNDNSLSHCDIHMGKINGFIDNCNWNGGTDYITGSSVFNDCSKDLFDAGKMNKVIKIFSKYVLSAADEEIMVYIQDIGNQSKQEISILLGLYNFFHQQKGTESWKRISRCDVSKYFLEKASIYYKLFINLLILETESKYKKQTEKTIEQYEYCPECSSKDRFKLNNQTQTIRDIAGLTIKYYMDYGKYAEEAYAFEGCAIVPVDEQIKMIESYQNK